jgi:hypothetical protein
MYLDNSLYRILREPTECTTVSLKHLKHFCWFRWSARIKGQVCPLFTLAGWEGQAFPRVGDDPLHLPQQLSWEQHWKMHFHSENKTSL